MVCRESRAGGPGRRAQCVPSARGPGGVSGWLGFLRGRRAQGASGTHPFIHVSAPPP